MKKMFQQLSHFLVADVLLQRSNVFFQSDLDRKDETICPHDYARARMMFWLCFMLYFFLNMITVSVAEAETKIFVQNNTRMRLSANTTMPARSLSTKYWQQTSSIVEPGRRAEVLRFNRDKGITNGREFIFETSLLAEGSSLVLKQRLKGALVNSHMWQSLRGPGFDHPWFDDRNTHNATWSISGTSFQVKYRAFITGTDDNIEYILQESNAVSPGQPNTFDVLTYNVYMRPTSLFLNGQNIRARLIPPLISGYDAIVFQEAFDDDARRILVSGLRSEYPHQSRILGSDRGINQDGGVIIVSRWPIRTQRQRLFGNVCEGSDCNAEKGILYVALDKGGRTYHLFGTHLEADDGPTRRRQLEIFRAFVDNVAPPTTEPVLFAGDFNINREAASPTEFNNMLRQLSADAPVRRGLRFSSDGTINDLSSGGQGFIDHVLFSTRHDRPENSYNFVRLIRATEEWKELPTEKARWDLSDHFPVHGHFVFPMAGGDTAELNEDCISFNPERLRVVRINGRWKIVDGDHWLFDFSSSEAEARRGLEIIRHYNANRICYVVRPHAPLEYLLTARGAPMGAMAGEDCVALNPAALTVVNIDSDWMIVDGAQRLLNFKSRADHAEKARRIIQQYEFTRACYVGRPDPTFTYMRR